MCQNCWIPYPCLLRYFLLIFIDEEYSYVFLDECSTSSFGGMHFLFFFPFFFSFFFLHVLLLSVIGMQFDNPYNKVFWVAFHSCIYQTFPGSIVEFIFCYAIFKLTKCSILNCDLLLSLLPSCYISLWSKSSLQCIRLQVDSGEKVG